MSTTPRTDALQTEFNHDDSADPITAFCEMAEHARQLELELISLREEYNNSQHAYMADNSKLVAENKKLELENIKLKEELEMLYQVSAGIVVQRDKLLEVARAARLAADNLVKMQQQMPKLMYEAELESLAVLNTALKSLEESGVKI